MLVYIKKNWGDARRGRTRRAGRDTGRRRTDETQVAAGRTRRVPPPPPDKTLAETSVAAAAGREAHRRYRWPRRPSPLQLDQMHVRTPPDQTRAATAGRTRCAPHRQRRRSRRPDEKHFAAAAGGRSRRAPRRRRDPRRRPDETRELPPSDEGEERLGKLGSRD